MPAGMTPEQRRITAPEMALCTRCGRVPAKPGRKRCAPCLSKQNEGYAALRQARINIGLCDRCGKVPPTEGKLTCAACMEKQCQRSRKWRYGLTDAQYREMYEAQGGRCAICGRHEEVLDVDHDHETGDVRDLLCHSCNITLGAAREDPTVLEAAKQYVLKWKESSNAGRSHS